MTEEREKIRLQLAKRLWFKATDAAIQEEILALPEDFAGFLEDLASRPDEIGELEVLKMTKLGRGNFLLLPVFEVRSNITNQIFTYEYASWKTGSHPGARAIIFLETDGEITHFMVSRSHNFSTGEEDLESIGGLYVHFLAKSAQNLPKKIEQEICFHLGVEHLEFKKIIPLGEAHPDLGMTNNVSDLFAAIIDISDVPNLTTKSDFRETHKPVGFELKIIHISEFMEYLDKIKDNYFLSAAARVLASHEISLPL
jgi:hypothetical protein